MSAPQRKFGTGVPISVEIDLKPLVKSDRSQQLLYTTRFRCPVWVQRLEEQVRTNLPPRCTLADFQREVYTKILIAYADYLEINRGKVQFQHFNLADLEAMNEEQDRWEKFYSSINELGQRVTREYEGGYPKGAIGKVHTAIETIKSYCPGSTMETKALRQLYASIPEEIRITLPALPVSFGIEDFKEE